MRKYEKNGFFSFRKKLCTMGASKITFVLVEFYQNIE